jgi:hypothetical protein
MGAGGTCAGWYTGGGVGYSLRGGGLGGPIDNKTIIKLFPERTGFVHTTYRTPNRRALGLKPDASA